MSVITKIAARWLEAKFEEIPKAFAKYEERLDSFIYIMEQPDDSALWYSPGVKDRRLKDAWGSLQNYAVPITKWILETREIPPGAAKSVELMARLWQGSKTPLKILPWWEKNQALLKLLPLTQKWPEKTEGESLFKLGHFMVHDTMHLPKDKLEKIKAAILAADRILSNAGKFAKVLYGDLQIVGKLRQANTAAWYSVTNDALYIRPLDKDDLGSILHELGHRYWYQVMSADQRRAWENYYWEVRSGAPKLTDIMPTKVGDVFPFRSKMTIKGQGELKGRVTKIEDEKLWGDDPNVSISRIGLIEVLSKYTKTLAFPSDYAATSQEEHFAEVFRFYLLDKLDAKTQQDFERLT